MEQMTTVVKVRFFEAVNEVNKYGFVSNDELHLSDRFIRNCKVKQCFNCWAYHHFEIQCRPFIKCGNCEKVGHRFVECFISRFKVKCAVCGGFHRPQAAACHRHKVEKNKVKSTKADAALYISVPISKARPVSTLILQAAHQFFGDQPPPSSVERGGKNFRRA